MTDSLSYAIYDIPPIPAGTYWPFPLTFETVNPDQSVTPVNLTGYSIQVDVKKKQGDTVAFQLTTANGRAVIVTAAEGKAELRLTSAQIDELKTALEGKKGVYFLKLINPSAQPDRWMTGAIVVSPE